VGELTSATLSEGLLRSQHASIAVIVLRTTFSADLSRAGSPQIVGFRENGTANLSGDSPRGEKKTLEPCINAFG
jgi:hypothetical protein